ncbi:hypothetical protein COU59_03715, partial [Candidatus Pacearchaeota archaeon CG10_big_fil_rev_8_21_14_0_10_34_12]
MNKTKMMKKNLLVSFLAVLAVSLVAIAFVSASDLVSVESVKINGVTDNGNGDISVSAGEKIAVELTFEASEDASDVRLKASLEGTKVDSDSEIFVGDVEAGKRYIKTVVVQVPYELKDEVSDDLTLSVKVWNGDFKTELDDVTLRVQRASYNVNVVSVETPQTISAGDVVPVDVVLKNVGYNDLDDLYVSVKVAALNIEAKAYFGDVVAVEEGTGDNKDSDTVRGRLFLQVPYNAESGVYSLEVSVSNSEMAASKVKQVFVGNELPSSVIKSGNSLILVNPTSKLKVYTLVADAPATVSESVVVVPAGSSRTVTVESNSASQ